MTVLRFTGCRLCRKKKRCEKSDLRAYAAAQPWEKYKTLSVKCPDRDSAASAPDFFIPKLRMVIEFKMLTHQQYRGAVFHDIPLMSMMIRKLNRVQPKRPADWILHAEDLTIRERALRQIKPRELREMFLKAERRGRMGAFVPGIGRFMVVRWGGSRNPVIMLAGGGKPLVCWMPGVIETALRRHLEKANRQIGEMKVRGLRRGIAVVQPRWPLDGYPKELRRVATALRNEISEWYNIDEIWHQTPDNTFGRLYKRNAGGAT